MMNLANCALRSRSILTSFVSVAAKYDSKMLAARCFSTVVPEAAVAAPAPTPAPQPIQNELFEEYRKEIDEIYAKYDANQKRKQEIIGVVTSTKAAKSITVTYFHRKLYAKYNTYIPMKRKVMAHDEEQVCSEGDIVRVIPCRPMSKSKRHILYEVVRKVVKLDSSITKTKANIYPASKGGKRGEWKEEKRKARRHDAKK